MIRIGPQPTDPYVERFMNAGAMAVLFEFKARLVADNTPALREGAFRDLTLVVGAVIQHFDRRLAPAEKRLLQAAVVLRNKLLHQELSRVTGKLVSLGEELRRGGVWGDDLATGDVVAVKDTSTANGRLFGWLLESAGSGAFDVARAYFVRGRNVFDRLLLAGTDQINVDPIDVWARARAFFHDRAP